jgi:hypothetical protein
MQRFRGQRGSDFFRSRAVPQHSAHKTSVTIAYRWHPLHGQTLCVRKRDRRHGNAYVVVQLPDDTLCALPVWMTDPAACAGMALGPAVVSCDALLELCRFIAGQLAEGGARSSKGAALANSTSAGSSVSRSTAGSPERRRARATRQRNSSNAAVRNKGKRK